MSTTSALLLSTTCLPALAWGSQTGHIGAGGLLRRSVHTLSVLVLLSVASPSCDLAGNLPIDKNGNISRQDSDPCTVTFDWLQKDAYKETAGRTSDLWPPHTTTRIHAVCTRLDGTEDVITAFMANHGTEPGEKDANGDVFLTQVQDQRTQSTRGKVLRLIDAYEGCECGNEFLSMDILDDELVAGVMEALLPYVSENLDCGGDPSIDTLVGWLSAGDIESVLAALPNCQWGGDSSLELGLEQALTTALAGSVSIGDTHVCNNDAALQSELWSVFNTDGTVGSCDPANTVCAGPMWLYTP